jgi:hypothetical protein
MPCIPTPNTPNSLFVRLSVPWLPSSLPSVLGQSPVPSSFFPPLPLPRNPRPLLPPALLLLAPLHWTSHCPSPPAPSALPSRTRSGRISVPSARLMASLEGKLRPLSLAPLAGVGCSPPSSPTSDSPHTLAAESCSIRATPLQQSLARFELETNVC